MTIREWQEGDIPRIAEIEKLCFSCPWTKENFLSAYRLPVSYAFVAEEDGEIVGYCCMQSLFEEAELHNIAVLPARRGQGLAAALLAAGESRACSQGAEKCFLEVRASNLPALKLYEKFGYERMGLRKRYYPDGEDAILMRKTL